MSKCKRVRRNLSKGYTSNPTPRPRLYPYEETLVSLCFMCGVVSGCASNGDIELNNNYVAFTTVFDPGGNKIVT